MNRVFITLSFLMGVVVLTSNYLVQFPINYFGLNEILTYGAFSYPVAFLITDISNRFYGKMSAKKIVYIGFAIGISFTLLFSKNFADLICIYLPVFRFLFENQLSAISLNFFGCSIIGA